MIANRRNFMAAIQSQRAGRFEAQLTLYPVLKQRGRTLYLWRMTYWEYVKTNDLEKYRGLWHESFVSWPLVSAAPIRKDHITDWITNNTAKGLKLRSYAIEQLDVRVTGDIAINHLPDQNNVGQ